MSRSATLLLLIAVLAMIFLADRAPAPASMSESPSRISMLQEEPNPFAATDGGDDSPDDSGSNDSGSGGADD